MNRTLRHLGEDGLLALLNPILARHTAGLPLGTGDDVALTPPGAPDQRLAWTIDTMIEGTHFRFWPGAPGAEWLGRKLAAVNLSDLASKGAQPLFAMLSLGLPGETPEELIRGFYAGLDQELSRHGARLIGGDTVRAPQWSVTLALVGQLPANSTVASRDRAQPGQSLYVTGHPGRSGAGLHLLEHASLYPAVLMDAHLRPQPRLGEGRALIESFRDIAMMDVSDGVARDAARMSARSGVRIVIEEQRIPDDPHLHELTGILGKPPRHFFLFGGEDYELLFATHATEAEIRAAFTTHRITTPVTRIGSIEKGNGVVLRRAIAPDEDLTSQGFEHFT